MDLQVIHNPAAGQSGQRRFQAVLAGLAAADCRITVHQTHGPGHASQLAAVAAVNGSDRLVIAGGDGTINEVVNGLTAVTSPPPIAIVPMGTANVLAAEIGLAVRTEAIVETILHGEPTSIPIGLIGERRFVLMAGVGFDARVVAGVNKAVKRRVGKLAYAMSFAAQLLRFGFAEYQLVVDGVALPAASAVVTNVRRYAGPYVIAPDADLRQENLQVCRFLKTGRWAAITQGIALFSNRLTVGPHFAIEPGRRIEIDGPAGDPVQADGDIVAALPVEISVAPSALKLVYPPHSRP